MTDRIASFSLTSQMTRQSLRLEAAYAQATRQQSSGLKAESFTGIAADAQRLLNLQGQFSTISAQVAALASANSKLTRMQDSLQGMSNMLNSMLSSVNGAVHGSTLTTDTVSAWRDQLASLLNTKHQGQYLFGGSVTGIAPVDLSAADYYQGDDTLPTVKASDSLRVNYGVTANEQAFRDMFAALDTIAAAPTDSTALTAAYAQLNSAYDQLANLQGWLGTQAATIEQQSDIHSATLDYLDTHISNINAVDLAATSLKLSQIETQLEASYSSLATLMNLKLTDYL